MSGTSADGVDAVLCRITGTGRHVQLRLLAHRFTPLPRALTLRIASAATAQDVAELDAELGTRFGRAVLGLLKAEGIPASRVDFVASHGQTLVHLPRRLSRTPNSLQVGEPARIAALCGLPVVADFRPGDMAVGGEGAPLVPYADWALFRPARGFRALQNIGGIANVSVVGARLEDTLAFDTGPGNMLLDALVRRHTKGALGYDRGGRLAAQGKVLPRLLESLLRHPFLAERPPRSAGRENFGEPLAQRLWAHHGHAPLDLLATAAAFTVHSIAGAYRRWVLPRRPLESVWVSGGGSRNPVLMDGLRAALAPVPVRPFTGLGLPEAAKEAACFALLGHECVMGTPQNVPSATGARRRVVLGRICLG